MEFEHAIHEEVHRKVGEYLGELFDQPVREEEDGHFYVRYGTTVLEISVDAYGPEEVSVTVMAYCVQDVNLDESLLLGLLDLNHKIPFGSFSVVGSDVFFSYSLFGRSLDRRTLLGAIAAVATVSDDYDDRIAASFGGQTALDRIQNGG